MTPNSTYNPNISATDLNHTYIDTGTYIGPTTITSGDITWHPGHIKEVEELNARLARLEKLINMPVRDQELENEFDWLKETGDAVDQEMAEAVDIVLSALRKIGSKYDKALQDAEVLHKLNKNND